MKLFLQTKSGTALELLLFFAVAMSTLQLGIIIPVLVVLVIGSMKIRKIKYINLGFSKTDFTAKNIFMGIMTAFFYFILFQYFIDPLISQIAPENLPAIFMMKGNIPKLILGLIASWTIAAFFEEIIFRGYLINRLIDLFGERFPSNILVVLMAGIAFGFMHCYQAIHGVILAGLIGIFQSSIYFAVKKKLAIPIIAHGTFDSIGFVLLFLK